MKRRSLLIGIGLSTLLVACGKRAKLKAVPTGSTVLAFGDSVTFGTGASPGEDWPTQLASMTGWRIVNAGVPGDTAEAGRARIPALLAEHQPALVIIEMGGNDFLRRRPQTAVKEDLRAILGAARQQGVPAVLVAVPELSLLGALTRRPSDAPIYLELGKEEKIPVIEDVFSKVLGKPELCADQIHPNAQGYRLMAEGIRAALQQNGLVSR